MYQKKTLILHSNMMKEIYEKFPKTQIQTMPQARFAGRVFVITTENEADRAVSYLLTQDILGFDSETRPTFSKWQHHQVALLQVSSKDTCFLFRLNVMGLCDSIVTLLSDTKITKIGLSLRDDFRALKERRTFEQGNFVDLQNEVKKIGILDCSLQKIYANLFGEKISKSQQLSNWEADILSEGQKAYASLDAWACIRIYEEVQKLSNSKEFTLIPSPQPTENEVTN